MKVINGNKYDFIGQVSWNGKPYFEFNSNSNQGPEKEVILVERATVTFDQYHRFKIDSFDEPVIVGEQINRPLSYTKRLNRNKSKMNHGEPQSSIIDG